MGVAPAKGDLTLSWGFGERTYYVRVHGKWSLQCRGLECAGQGLPQAQ